MSAKRNTARQNRRGQVWARVEKKKVFGPPVKNGRLKIFTLNLYTKSERLTFSCRGIWLWSEKVNLCSVHLCTNSDTTEKDKNICNIRVERLRAPFRTARPQQFLPAGHVARDENRTSIIQPETSIYYDSRKGLLSDN